MDRNSLCAFSDLYPTYTGTETSNRVVADDSDTDMLSGTDSETVEMTTAQKRPKIFMTLAVIIGAVALMAAFTK